MENFPDLVETSIVVMGVKISKAFIENGKLIRPGHLFCVCIVTFLTPIHP